jgi:hypothetical protein
MPAIVRSYAWSIHDHGISQNGRKAQQNGPVAYSPTEKSAKPAPFRLVTPLCEKLAAYMAEISTFATPGPVSNSPRQNFRYVCGSISRPDRLIVTPTTMVVAVGACEAPWGWGAMGRKSSNTYQHPSGRPAVTRSTGASPEFILLTITTSPGWSGAARLLSSKRTHRAWWRAPFVPVTTTSGSSTVIMVRRSSFA